MEIISPAEHFLLEEEKKKIPTAYEHLESRVSSQLLQSEVNRLDGRKSSLPCRAQLKWRSRPRKHGFL